MVTDMSGDIFYIDKNPTLLKQSYDFNYVYGDISFGLNIYFDSVQPPDEQTHLLAEALIDRILPNLPIHSICIDVGSGAGMHAVLVGKYSKVNHKRLEIIALDYSEKAVISTLRNANSNNVSDNVLVLKSNLYEGIHCTGEPSFIAKNLIDYHVVDRRRINLIYANPPMMPSFFDEIQCLSDQVLGNLDYVGKTDVKSYTDGLGVIRSVIEGATKLLAEEGMLVIVTADFLSEGKIRALFENNGFSFSVLLESKRKIRTGGFTWSHMEVIEKACQHQFENVFGETYESVEIAKNSGCEIYYNMKVYLGVFSGANIG